MHRAEDKEKRNARVAPNMSGVNKILRKLRLSSNSVSVTIEAPMIARKVKPGQFVIVRCNEKSERIPFTVADWDTSAGIITLLIQEVGRSTRELGALNMGECITDIVGPLGIPSDIEYFGKVICIGGGFGIAAIYPIAKALKDKKNIILSIIGARTKELLIMKDELRAVSDELKLATEDGSAGAKGLVTDILKEILITHNSELITHNSRVYAIGPVAMMKAVYAITKSYNIKTIVSLNPIMLDGTGMCGACRVNIGGKTKFTCVDGPDFDASLVDFDCLTRRQKMYLERERYA